MKPIHYIKAAIIGVAALSAASCTYDPYDNDMDPVRETMVLKCENPKVEIDANNLNTPALTFTWTGARHLSEQYMVSYKAELDVLGNGFGSKTVVTSGAGFDYTYDEATGIYSATFTHEQLNNWYADRWAIDGNAVAASGEISKTLENENVYAWKGALVTGELQIPVEYEGVTYYLHNADGSTDIADGTPMALVMNESKGSWTIPAAGEYRIVINMTDKTATIYSAATDLQPLVVTFHPNGEDALPEVSLEVTDLYAFGAGTGWEVKTLNLVQSLADPQVFIFDGANNALGTLGGQMKFCISKSFSDSDGASYNQNNSFCYTCPLTGDGKSQNIDADLNKVFDLHGAADLETRNSYMGVPWDSNFIVFDLRHRTFLASKK